MPKHTHEEAVKQPNGNKWRTLAFSPSFTVCWAVVSTPFLYPYISASLCDPRLESPATDVDASTTYTTADVYNTSQGMKQVPS